MRQGSISDLSRAVLSLVLAAALYERNFVVPPHDVAPVRLIVLLKLCIKFQVLPDAHYDVIRRDTRVGLVTALIPPALTEVESSYTQRHINNGSLLGSLVFHFDTSEFGILVSRHEQDSTLG